jgi:hypothetical protein
MDRVFVITGCSLDPIRRSVPKIKCAINYVVGINCLNGQYLWEGGEVRQNKAKNQLNVHYRYNKYLNIN